MRLVNVIIYRQRRIGAAFTVPAAEAAESVAHLIGLLGDPASADQPVHLMTEDGVETIPAGEITGVEIQPGGLAP